MVKVEGDISKQSRSILIDLRCTQSYLTPRIVESCHLIKKKHAKSWLVQLATGRKRKVMEVVRECPIEMNGFLTIVDLNILLLGLYDALIGMDWLEKHRSKVDYYVKVMECLDEK